MLAPTFILDGVEAKLNTKGLPSPRHITFTIKLMFSLLNVRAFFNMILIVINMIFKSADNTYFPCFFRFKKEQNMRQFQLRLGVVALALLSTGHCTVFLYMYNQT
jgi:hypothetical protein